MSITLSRHHGFPLERERSIGLGAGRQSGASPDADIQTPRRLTESIGLAIAVVAAVVIYALFIVRPYSHMPLKPFLATFNRGNAEVWPMQIVWYAAALAMAGLALFPARRSSQLICLLAAVYVAWVGIAYFTWVYPALHLSSLWAAGFTLQAAFLLVAGVVRRDLVIELRRNLASALGAIFVGYALVAYPAIGMLGGHPLRTLPVFGLAPCPTVIFCFGLLLLARPPVPKYLLLAPMAWALTAAPSALGTGVVADGGLVVAGVITAVLIIWRDRISTWQPVAAGLSLALMVVLSGHDNLEIGAAFVLLVVMFAQTTRRGMRSLRTGGPPRPESSAEVLNHQQLNALP